MNDNRPIKVLVWIYVVLLIFEGALRKWVLPELANPLLVVRDPFLVMTYFVALSQGRFPMNRWLGFAGFLSVAAVLGAFLAGQTNLLITLYGFRSSFFHLPLIWIIATQLSRREIENLCKFLLIIAIPMTILMVIQYYSPIRSYINRGVGTEEGAMGQIYGAMGHIRPPGFFSFITGPNLFFPIAAAAGFAQIHATRRLWLPLLIGCFLSIVVAIPVSISRTLIVSVGAVGAAYCLALWRTGRFFAGLFRVVLISAAVFGLLMLLPVFQSSVVAFMSRWETAGRGNEVGIESVAERIFGGGDFLAEVLASASFFGHGIGMGSSVASKIVTGQSGFMLAENEWAKNLLELGILLGLAYNIYRFALAIYLGWRSMIWWWKNSDPLPLLLASATIFPVLAGQWAQPTSLGFSIIGAGLTLGAMQTDPEDSQEGDDEETDCDDDSDIVDEDAEAESSPDDPDASDKP